MPSNYATISERKTAARILAIASWLPSYEKRWLRPDIIAGITLAAYAIPVSVAYSSLAGLPPQAGLYCYFAGGIAYSLFGTSRQSAIGPTSAMSMLIGATLATLGGTSRFEAAAVAVIAGAIGTLAWLLRLGNLTNFVSETVLSGFKLGAALVIASTQVPKLLGFSAGGSNFFVRIVEVTKHLSETNLPTLYIGAGALVILIIGARFAPGRPIAIMVVIASTVMMSFSSLAAAEVKTVGEVPDGLPKLVWPVFHWNEVNNLLGLALACFLLSYVESISVAKTFAVKHRYSVHPGQELLALGMANLAAGVAQGFPVAGGMSQSAVNEQAGAKTPMALLIASSALGLVLLFLTRFMSNLPEPVLAAIVMIAVGGLMKLGELRHLARTSKAEFLVAMVATAGVLGFGILKGVLLAALFSIVVLLQRASRPRVAELGRIPGTARFADLSRNPGLQYVPAYRCSGSKPGCFISIVPISTVRSSSGCIAADRPH